MFKARHFIILLVLNNSIAISQDIIYHNQDSSFVTSKNLETPFLEAIKYCKKLSNGELAVIKSRNLAEEIEKALSESLKEAARKWRYKYLRRNLVSIC